MFGLSPMELMIIGAVAVLLFGNKLPDLARSLGGSYREFRKGLHEIQSQMDVTSYSHNAKFNSTLPKATSSPAIDDDYDDYQTPTAPKFEPPAAEPQEKNEAT